jgi:hypothetical protein
MLLVQTLFRHFFGITSSETLREGLVVIRNGKMRPSTRLALFLTIVAAVLLGAREEAEAQGEVSSGSVHETVESVESGKRFVAMTWRCGQREAGSRGREKLTRIPGPVPTQANRSAQVLCRAALREC